MSAAENGARRHSPLRRRTAGRDAPAQVRRKDNTMFCNSCNGNNSLWLIILIIILFGCGNNCGCGCN